MDKDEQNLINEAKRATSDNLAEAKDGERKIFPNLNLQRYNHKVIQVVEGHPDLFLIDTYNTDYLKLVENHTINGGRLEQLTFTGDESFVTALNVEQLHLAIVFALDYGLIDPKKILYGISKTYNYLADEVQELSQKIDNRQDVPEVEEEQVENAPVTNEGAIGDALINLTGTEYLEKVPPEVVKDYYNTINKMVDTLGNE